MNINWNFLANLTVFCLVLLCAVAGIYYVIKPGKMVLGAAPLIAGACLLFVRTRVAF